MATLAVPASAAPPHVASLRSSSSHVRQDGRRAATSAVLFPAATCISNCSLLASSLQETRGISSSSSSSATQRYLHYYSISTTTMTRFLGLCLSSQSDLNLCVACIIHPSPCIYCCLDRCKEEKGSSSCRATRSSYKTKEIQQSRLIFRASHQGHSNVRHGGAAQDGSKEVQLLWAG